MKRKTSLCVRIFIVAIVLVLSNCQQDVQPTIKLGEDNAKASVPPYPFDWETADFVPTPSGMNPIPVPWGNGVSILYNPAIRYDYKSVNGWTLLYNTFNTTSIPNPSFFALYNRYRGVIRYYWWIPANNNTLSTYLEEHIAVQSPTGKTTSFFNFTGKEIIDPTVKPGFSEQTQAYQIPSSGGWYVSQYEVGYDKNLQSLHYTDMGLYLTLKYYQITSVTLNGFVDGTAKGTVTTPSSTLDNLFSVAAQAAMAFVDPEAALISTLRNTIDLESIKTDGAAGVVEGIGNLVAGTLEDDTQEINLSIALTAKLNGTNTSSGAIFENYAIAMPGLQNSTSGAGYVPANNDPLGVFNLPVRPIIHTTSHFLSQANDCYGERIGYYTLNMSLDAATQAYLNSSNVNSFNPAVINSSANGATVGPIHYNILGPDPGEPCFTVYPGEVIGGQDLYKLKSIGQRLADPIQAGDKLYLRVYFDVIPNNGSKKVTIVKTFAANVVATVN